MKSKLKAGDTKINHLGDTLEVLEFVNSKNILVRFISTGFEVRTTVSAYKFNLIKDRLKPSICDTGFVGAGSWKTTGTHKPLYVKWTTMLRLCYGDKDNMFYIGDKVHVCEEWLNYQTFCDWLNANGGTTKETRLKRAKGATVFSPGTCKIVNKGK